MLSPGHYSNNRTGECYPKMETLAKTLKRSVRTIQRHLHLLRERGVIEFVERRRAIVVGGFQAENPMVDLPPYAAPRQRKPSLL